MNLSSMIVFQIDVDSIAFVETTLPRHGLI